MKNWFIEFGWAIFYLLGFGRIVKWVIRFSILEEDRNNIRLKFGWIRETGEPQRCSYCGCNKHEDFTLNETTERVCKRCRNVIGYSNYGKWRIVE